MTIHKLSLILSIFWLFVSGQTFANSQQDLTENQNINNNNSSHQSTILDTTHVVTEIKSDSHQNIPNQINEEIITNQGHSELYSFVDRWLNTPYRYGGNSKRGTDCSGFVSVLHDSLYHIKLPRSSRMMYLVTKPIPKTELQAGDLLFFKIGRGVISHVGIYLKDNKFAHATTNRGVVISDLDEPYYRRWYFNAGRLEDNTQIVQ